MFKKFETTKLYTNSHIELNIRSKCKCFFFFFLIKQLRQLNYNKITNVSILLRILLLLYNTKKDPKQNKNVYDFIAIKLM